MPKLPQILLVAAFALFASANSAGARGSGQCSKINCTATDVLCGLFLDAAACGVAAACCTSNSSSSDGPPICKNGASPICYPACDVGCETQMGITYTGLPTISTNLSPASASAYDLNVELGVSKTGQIFYNWWFLGKAGRGWSELSAGGQTHDDPAVSAVPIIGGVYVFAAIRGLDGNLYLNQGAVSGPFVGWQSMDFKSPYAPALSSSGKTTAVVAADSAGHIRYNFWQLGSAGGGWKDLGAGHAKGKPAVALIGNYLFVVVRDPDGQLYLNQGALGGAFVGWRRLGFAATSAPAATSADNKAVIVAAGPNGHISYQWWTLGGAGTVWKELDGGGKWGSAPSASLTGDSYLFVAVKGANDDGLYLNQGALGKPFVGWQKQ